MDLSDERKYLLIVEDEEHLASALKLNFELEGYDVDLARTTREVGALLMSAPGYDAIILDITLPDGNGFDLCRRLRDANNLAPILMLTARNSAEDRVQGLDAGADDYVTKPFELNELLARVRSMLRRRRWDVNSDNGIGEAVLEFGTARVNFQTQEVLVGTNAVKLTTLELELLRYFARNPGRVIGRDELLEEVWKLKNFPNTRTVDNFIVRLRKHFEPDPEKPIHFVSHRGSGYKFIPSPN
ncbi:MAG: response regulator transcription factor [Deltaproteobacteria bacterium]|nr:response regulator transcription factor [Deltaproteobacteria bacterium]